MTELPRDVKRTPPAGGETTTESLTTGAAGGAALGSVISLAFATGSVLLPLVGGAAGAIGGAALGYVIRRVAAQKKAKEKRGGDEPTDQRGTDLRRDDTPPSQP